MGVIYKITNQVNGKSYIGQTIDFRKRMNQHFNASDNYAIHLAIRKYGAENFKTEIIEECPKEKLNEREQYWIRYYNTFNYGYNMTTGGDNAGALDRWRKDNPDKATENALYGLQYANKWREEHPEEAYQISLKMQKAGVEKVKRKVRCVELNLIFNSISDAEKWSLSEDNPNGKICHHQHISKVCKGKRKTTGGYHWEYIINEGE